MLRPVNISVPLGKGVDESADPHLQRPPLSRRSENLRPELAGSLRKRPGFASGGPAGADGANILIGNGARALQLGPSPARIITADGSTDLEHASPLPLTVTPHRLRAVSGFGHCAQLARSGGYTATIVSVLGDVTAHAVGSQMVQWDYVCEATIWDADWRPVWGPHRIPELRWLPRVEPIAIDENTFGFVFFALGTDVVSPAAPVWNGALVEDIGLYVAQGFPLGPVPSASLLGAVAPVEVDGEDRWKIYDTHSDGESRAYAAWIQQPSTDYLLAVARTTGASSSVVTENLGDTIDRDRSVSIWRDATSDTVLVHHTETSTIYFTDGALTPGLGALGIAALDGVGAPSTVDDFAGSDWQVPEFYRAGSGQLYLNELPITLTGSGPATPSVGAAITPSLAHLYKPQVMGGQTVYSRASMVTTPLGGDHWGWASHAELYHLAEHPAYAAPRPQVDLSLMESRFGAEAFGAYSLFTNKATSPAVSACLPCVVGQAAAGGGRLFLPLLPLTDQQNPRAEVTGITSSGEFFASPNRGTYHAITAGAGHYNDEQYLCVLEVDPSAPVYSAESHEASTLIAAGHPTMWAGEAVHPVVPRAPVITAYSIPTGTVERQVDPSAVGIVNGGAHWGGGGDPVSYTRDFAVRAVLVFTDSSGLEYRSAPSRALIVEDGIDGAGPSGFPTYLPAIDLSIEPSVLPFLGAGRALDVELYVTERRDVAGTDVDETTYTMIGRMPLQQDGDGAWFVLDTMQDLACRLSGSMPNPDVEPGWENPPHAKPLYTTAGELANLPPPTSHVTAQVAGYAFLVPSEAPYEVWSSKPLVKGRAPEWNPALITYAPPACGGVVSLASAYDRLFLLCRAGVWELPVLGGPNALGEGSFGAPQIVYRGQGCTSHMGTVETSAGVFYVTRSGPRLLSGSGSLDVGRAVRTAIDWTAVVAATYGAEQDEITWWTADGSVSYSLRHEAWSTSTLGTLAAAVWGDGVIRLRAGTPGSVVFESRAVLTDGGDSILGRYTSPWLSFEDVQGYKRVWEVMVLGRLHGGTFGRLQIGLEYDYVETVVDTYEWTLAQLSAFTKGLQISCKPARQQLDAIRITVRELEEDTGTVGQDNKPILRSDIDWTITGINLRVGAKVGLMKLQEGAKR